MRKYNQGFTLLEVSVAIFILALGVTGVLSVVEKTSAFTSFSTSRLQAVYLIEEGLEIVKNIRDTNWLKQYYKSPEGPNIPWDEGLICSSPPCQWEADYTMVQNLTPWSGEGRYLYIDEKSGFYKYIDSPSASDIKTKFKRKITVQKPGPDTLNIRVEVNWTERGTSYALSARADLYNWSER